MFTPAMLKRAISSRRDDHLVEAARIASRISGAFAEMTYYKEDVNNDYLNAIRNGHNATWRFDDGSLMTIMNNLISEFVVVIRHKVFTEDRDVALTIIEELRKTCVESGWRCSYAEVTSCDGYSTLNITLTAHKSMAENVKSNSRSITLALLEPGR